MKKLEDIPKKDIFEVPDGYFDRLPGVIQARVAGTKRESVWLPYLTQSLKYALPVVVIGVVSFFYLSKPQEQSAEMMIASINSGQLVAYLEDSDISTDDLLENIPLNHDEADAIQQNSMEISVGDADLEDLSNELGDYF
ncbi:hypothetical protein BH10BAC4_BH10BAC4_16780 [soil metagenome]